MLMAPRTPVVRINTRNPERDTSETHFAICAVPAHFGPDRVSGGSSSSSLGGKDRRFALKRDGPTTLRLHSAH